MSFNTMKKSRIKSIADFGQSIWLDFFDRDIMNTGKLEKLIHDDGVSGVTSNPSIFEKAIVGSLDYDEDINFYLENNLEIEKVFTAIEVKDIQRAADFFKPIYTHTKGNDGFVSIEVSPHLARNTNGTIQQARELWKAVNRENVMIKIPATKEGLPAIRKCTSEGININITLLFGLPRYREVTEAYISGLEDRISMHQPIDTIASVASFFLSRIDVLTDPLLAARNLRHLKGEVAIASAKVAYQMYREIFKTERFKKLESSGAKRQHVLWASTSSKNPSFSDVKYVEALIGEETINTLPLHTIDAFNDHGKVANQLENDLDKAKDVLSQLSKNGIDINMITRKLENDGIEKFNKAYAKLLNAIEVSKKKPVKLSSAVH